MMLNSNHKPIGGEQEIAHDGLFYGTTNSGRSSLRWVLLSMGLQGKRVLVPDFVCQVVVDVLHEYKIHVDFYNVKENFEFSLPECLDDYDALYIVKYFGHESATFKRAVNNSTLPLIIDCVFDVQLPEINTQAHWCYFNSLRKITVVADFSQIVSNKPLFIINKVRISSFSEKKYQAKEAKYKFLHSSQGREATYLKYFSNAESIIDENKNIFESEDKSIYLMGCFYSCFKEDLKIRLQNLTFATTILSDIHFIKITPTFPSFLPLLLNKRDEVRRELMKDSIYLAIHWPAIEQSKNHLSDKLLSLPLDSRYTKEDIERMCDIIKRVEK